MSREAAREVLTCNPPGSLRSTAAGGSPSAGCRRGPWNENDEDRRGKVREGNRNSRANHSAAQLRVALQQSSSQTRKLCARRIKVPRYDCCLTRRTVTNCTSAGGCEYHEGLEV